MRDHGDPQQGCRQGSGPAFDAHGWPTSSRLDFLTAVMGVIIKAFLRESLTHPWQLVLTLFSIAAGVSVVVGVDIANQAALNEFERANRTIDGVATHRIVGGAHGLDERIFRQIKVDAGIREAAPVISAEVSIKGRAGTFHLLGIDPLSDFRIRDLQLSPGQDLDQSTPGWPLYIPETLIKEIGQSLQLQSGSRIQLFNIAGILNSGGAQSATLSRILVTDIAWAQSFLESAGRLDYIELKLPAGFDQTALERELPDSARLVNVELYNNSRSDMTRAFRINLTALSLLALVIAMFLIYSTVSFQVVRRRPIFALLKAIGVTSFGLATVIIAELALLGITGTLCGILLGSLLANSIGAMVSETINALYYSLVAPENTASWSVIYKAALLGLGTTLLASALPVVTASRTTVRGLLLRSSEETVARKLSMRFFYLAFALLIVGAGILVLSRESLVLGFAGLFLLILSLAGVAPWVVRQLCRIVSKPKMGTLGMIPKMALTNVGAHLSRTSIAVAALSVAVSATLGVGLMIDSFRFSVERWLDGYLRSDIYMTSEAVGQEYLSPSFLAEIQNLEDVAHLSTGRRRTLSASDGPITLFTLQTSLNNFDGFQIKQGLDGDLWERFNRQDQVLISEPLARRRDLKPGDRINLPTDAGGIDFTIAAVYFDYSSDQGLVTMDRQTYRRYFDDELISSAAVVVNEGVDIGAVMARIKNLSGAPTELFLRSNKGLRNASLEVFDQTFRITEVLRWLAIIVAVVGIVSALMALQLERGREYATLKAIGFSRFQLATQILIETGITGFFAGLMAVPMGIALAVCLIKVINVRSFGWSMHTVIDGVLIGQSMLLAVVAAAIAGLYPAVRLWRTEIASGLRNE
ncbi:MAG: FtsX-like permease family protein [bacterium]